jgi:hypothetical protein
MSFQVPNNPPTAMVKDDAWRVILCDWMINTNGYRTSLHVLNLMYLSLLIVLMHHSINFSTGLWWQVADCGSTSISHGLEETFYERCKGHFAVPLIVGFVVVSVS